MSNLISSIVRGFGFTLGRTAANSLINSTQVQKVHKFKEIDCWSHNGYQEDDVESIVEYDYLKKQIKWYSWIIYFIPIINLFKSIPYFYNVFIKKNKIYYYDMKWESFQVSDGRVKGGNQRSKKTPTCARKSRSISSIYKKSYRSGDITFNIFSD